PAVQRAARGAEVPEKLDEAATRQGELRPLDARALQPHDLIKIVILHDPPAQQLQLEQVAPEPQGGVHVRHGRAEVVEPRDPRHLPTSSPDHGLPAAPPSHWSRAVSGSYASIGRLK